MGYFQEYQVVGRHLPTEAEPTPKIYRMRIFAPNEVVAKSRFWYFLRCVVSYCCSHLKLTGCTGNSKKSKKQTARSSASMSYVSFSYPSSPQEAGGMGFFNTNPRRSTRRNLSRSKTSVSGSDMIPAPAHTTCTRSTVICPGLMRSSPCTRIWRAGIAPVSAPST